MAKYVQCGTASVPIKGYQSLSCSDSDGSRLGALCCCWHNKRHVKWAIWNALLYWDVVVGTRKRGTEQWVHTPFSGCDQNSGNVFNKSKLRLWSSISWKLPLYFLGHDNDNNKKNIRRRVKWKLFYRQAFLCGKAINK